MLRAADFRQRGREALAGDWGKAVGVGFVASLLGAATTSAGGGGSTGSSSSDRIDSIADLNGVIPREFQITFLAIASFIGFIALLFLILHFIIGGAVTLGYVKFNLNLVDRKPASFSDLFSEFHRFGTAFLMQLLRSVFTFLWSLLFVIPGIYAAYGYAMTPYILLENPEMTANEAIAASKKLMDGNRWRLFCLEMSFIGWILLAVMFTCGIGVLWLVPYMEASNAAFYREIKAEKYGREEKKEDPYEGFYNSGSYTI
ncbi:MAG: DUF975 family protein [Lachnospiraceae bacterium]|nr:DUF975 family protein [Lachnospiraceae bacterium]